MTSEISGSIHPGIVSKPARRATSVFDQYHVPFEVGNEILSYVKDEQIDSYLKRKPQAEEPDAPAPVEHAGIIKWIAENCTDNNQLPKVGQPLWSKGLTHKKPWFVKTFLNNTNNLNPADRLGSTPLHVAITTGQPELAKDLVSQGANPFSTDYTGQSGLSNAVLYGQEALLEQIFEDPKGPKLESEKNTLRKNCQQQAEKIAKTRKLGNQARYNALLKALYNNSNEDGVAAIAAKADLDKRADYQTDEIPHHTYDGLTPLSAAAYKENLTLTNALIRAGVDINEGGSDASLPAVHYAARVGNLPLIKSFIDAGINVDKKLSDEQPVMPVDEAARASHLSVVKELLDHGANLHTTNPTDGRNLLHVAVLVNSVDLAKDVIDRGVDPNLREEITEYNVGRPRLTPLEMAKEFESSKDLIDYLETKTQS